MNKSTKAHQMLNIMITEAMLNGSTMEDITRIKVISKDEKKTFYLLIKIETAWEHMEGENEYESSTINKSAGQNKKSH